MALFSKRREKISEKGLEARGGVIAAKNGGGGHQQRLKTTKFNQLHEIRVWRAARLG